MILFYLGFLFVNGGFVNYCFYGNVKNGSAEGHSGVAAGAFIT